MLVIVIDILLIGLAAYLAAGLLYSIYFVFKGAAKMDEGVREAPWHFRLIIWPGIVLMWSVLLIKMIRK